MASGTVWTATHAELPPYGTPVFCLFADGRIAAGRCGQLIAGVEDERQVGVYWVGVDDGDPSWGESPDYWMYPPQLSDGVE
jgi:hypothetical protein